MTYPNDSRPIHVPGVRAVTFQFAVDPLVRECIEVLYPGPEPMVVPASYVDEAGQRVPVVAEVIASGSHREEDEDEDDDGDH